MPMPCRVVQDLSGRPHLSFDVDIPSDRIGTFDTQLVEHFFQSLANTSGMTLHIRHVLCSLFHSRSINPSFPCGSNYFCKETGTSNIEGIMKWSISSSHKQTPVT